MKLKYFLMLFTCLLIFFGGIQQTYAQLDTLDVRWDDPDNPGTPLLNALRDAVVGDTLEDGTHVQNRVYKLQKGGVYWNVDRMDNSGYHLRIVGEPGDPNDPNGFPPIIQRHYNEAGDFVDDKMIVGSGSLTLKNLYIIHCDDQGVQTAYQPIELNASGQEFYFDNVIFERTNFAVVAFTNGPNNIYVTNNVFRNLIGYPSTQQWEGRAMGFWVDQDTIVFENNTCFNVNFTPFQLEGGAANYVRVNHNTFVNIGRNMAVDGQNWIEAYFGNNLLINTFWHGEGNSDVSDPNRDPDAYYTGIWGVNDLPAIYGPEETRRILFAYNAAWRDPLFYDYYADTIRAQPFLSSIGKLRYVDEYDQMVVRDTMWLDSRPDFPTYFSESFIQDSMIQNIKDIRAGLGEAQSYFWKLPELAGDVCNVCPSWPLPEDFSYTDNLVGSDGLPLGDLNWFPDAKADFEANKEQYVAQLENLAGEKVEYPVIAEDEAEFGTLGGDAEVLPFQGFTYIAFEGSGNIVWEFEMESAQTVDLVVYTRSNDQVRGQHIRVNGTGIRNDAGYGEFYWDDLTTEWQEYTVTQGDLIEGSLELDAGTNTIEIAPSWGWQHFIGIDVVVGGEVLYELRAPNANQPISAPVQAEGADYVPHFFNVVDLGASGSIEWTFDLPTAGNYGLNIFYQAPNGTQTVQIEAGGQSISVELEGEAGDSSGLSVLSGVVPLSAGNQTFTLSGGNVLIDWVQLVREDVISGIRERDELPTGFALDQNYPNPFNPTTNINFSLGKHSNVKLTVYNILGQKVATLINNREMNAGAYTFEFNAGHLASGVYIYRLETQDFQVAKKMMLLK